MHANIHLVPAQTKAALERSLRKKTFYGTLSTEVAYHVPQMQSLSCCGASFGFACVLRETYNRYTITTRRRSNVRSETI